MLYLVLVICALTQLGAYSFKIENCNKDAILQSFGTGSQYGCLYLECGRSTIVDECGLLTNGEQLCATLEEQFDVKKCSFETLDIRDIIVNKRAADEEEEDDGDSPAPTSSTSGADTVPTSSESSDSTSESNPDLTTVPIETTTDGGAFGISNSILVTITSLTILIFLNKAYLV